MRQNKSVRVLAGAVLLLVAACSTPTDAESNGTTPATGDPSPATTTTTAATGGNSLGEILDAIRSGGANEERCGDLGAALGLGAPVSSARSACSYSGGDTAAATITISLSPGTNLASFTADAESKNGSGLDVCDGGYDVNTSGVYTLGALDGGRNVLYLINLAGAEDRAFASQLATTMCTS